MSTTTSNLKSATPGRQRDDSLSVWLSPETCSLDDFRKLVEQQTSPDSVPLASSLSSGIPVYEASNVRSALGNEGELRSYMSEWNRVFDSGPGVLAVREAYVDMKLIDDVTEALSNLIATEERSGDGSGDHFAPAGANSRLWNAQEKLCIASPELFAYYNANPVVPLVSRAWLGPGYQLTSQVNVVRPGGKAQTCHRDYHMGFQEIDALVNYPCSAHRLSAALTLQGAIAHTDMPLESGPTKILPYSQRYTPGYIAAQLDDFRDYFEEHFVQLALTKGDALFFNPAVFHAAGENRTTDVHRFANLMQIGSAFGRSIELVDRHRMSVALYPTLRSLARKKALDDNEVNNVIAACAEAYPFPANLDLDSPLAGMAPASQQDVLSEAVAGDWSPEALATALAAQLDRKRTH